MLASLSLVQDLGLRIRDTLEDGDTASFAALMHEHWVHKKRRSSQMSNDAIDQWYELGMANGALGGKLVGAGGGGFLLFYAREPERLRRAMEEAGLPEVRFTFDHDGSSIIVRG